MAVTLDHTEGNSLVFDDPSPAKTETGWAEIDAGDAGAGSYFDYVNIQLSIAFAAGIDGNATIKRRISADSGTTNSDVSIDILDVTYSAGNTKIITIQLQRFNFVDIGIYNGSSAVAEITISGKWEGLKVTDS